VDFDRTLVAEAAAGSREAFDELVTRHQRRVYNLVRALCGDDPDADDLVQDIFVRTYRGIRRFRGDSAFRSWLYRIAVNVIQSHLARRRTNANFVHEDVDVESLVEQIPASEHLEEDIVLRQAIDAALASLPDDLRVVVVLRDIQGLSYEEIAAAARIPLGTVDSRLFRARRRLRPLLRAVWASTGELAESRHTSGRSRIAPVLVQNESKS